jgi:hypothetical protein
MPIPPFIPLQTAVGVASDYLNIDRNKASAMLVDGMCDGRVIAWGGMKGELPHLIVPEFWMNFKYRGVALTFELVEVELEPLLIWLGIAPPNWRDLLTSGAPTSGAAKNAKVKSRRRNETRYEIKSALPALFGEPDWAKLSDGERCGRIEKHLGKEPGWCKLRTARRAIKAFEEDRAER